jgi:hypothetical protein
VTGTAIVIRRNTEKAEGVRSEWRVVSPELATKWLEGNTHNRKVRDAVVARYAQDMKAGRWKQTHQGIAFDEEGVLIDGQHRLYAILEADVPIVLQVTYGLPMESQYVVDDGIKRSVVDILKINGNGMAEVTSLHAAVARRMQAGLTSADHTPQTRQELGNFITKHWEAIHFVVSKFGVGAQRVVGVSSSGPVAALARAYYHVDEAPLIRFIEVLSSGLIQKDSESVIIVLRNWLLTSGGHGRVLSQEAYGKTQRALVAYLAGKPLTRNRLHAVTEDAYPLPKNGKA